MTRILSFVLIVAWLGRMPGVAYARGAGIALGIALAVIFVLSYAQYRGWRRVVRWIAPVTTRVRGWFIRRRPARQVVALIAAIVVRLGQTEKSRPERRTRFSRYVAIALPPLSPAGNGMLASAAMAEHWGLHRHWSAVIGAVANTIPVFVGIVLLRTFPWQYALLGFMAIVIAFVAYRLKTAKPTPSIYRSPTAIERKRNDLPRGPRVSFG